MTSPITTRPSSPAQCQERAVEAAVPWANVVETEDPLCAICQSSIVDPVAVRYSKVFLFAIVC